MKKRLFVLSIDSLTNEDLLYAKTLPVFEDIILKGSRVEHMEAVYPTLTYTVHASILTGVPPMTHGIYNNEKLVIGSKHSPWFWYQRDLKVPTIIDYAKNCYSTATVFFPCMGAGKADWIIPEIWTDYPGQDTDKVFETATTPSLINTIYEKEKNKLNWKNQPNFDEFSCSCIEDIIHLYQPEVMFSHLSLIDYTRHKYGVDNEYVRAAVKKSGHYIFRIIKALKEEQVFENTNIFLISDHGHMPVNRVVSPNVYLVEKGWIQLDNNQNIVSWDVYFHSCSLSAQVYVRNPDDIALMARTATLLNNMQQDDRFGIERILTAEELHSMYKLSGPFSFMIESSYGTAFSTDWTEDMVCDIDPAIKTQGLRASHGHLPHKGGQPVFLAYGPDIKKGIVVPYANVLDETPTFAKLLGISMPQCVGRALTEILQ